MLKWLLQRKIKAVIENEIADARLALSSMRLKLNKEGPNSTRVYGEGVGETAGLLAQDLKFPYRVPLRREGWIGDSSTMLRGTS